MSRISAGLRVSPQGGHEDRLVDRQTAFLVGGEQVLVGPCRHVLGVRMVPGLDRHVPDVDAATISLEAVTLGAIGPVIVLGRGGHGRPGNRRRPDPEAREDNSENRGSTHGRLLWTGTGDSGRAG